MQFFGNKIIKIIFIAITIISILYYTLFLHLFWVFKLRWNNMRPTLEPWKYIITDKTTYKFRDLERWEIIIFKPQNQEKWTFFIERIIWLPGEVIRFSNWKVFIKTKNNENFIELEENYLLEKNSTYFFENHLETNFTIPENHYWVMGDNRMNSLDSRNCFNKSGCTKNEERFLNKENIYGLVRF